MRLLIQRFMADDCGQDLIEYVLLCGFVTLGVEKWTPKPGQRLK